MRQRGGMRGVLAAYRPTAAEIDDLLRRASEHPLGSAYLAEGALDSVAATFRVHAFAVEAARHKLLAEAAAPSARA